MMEEEKVFGWESLLHRHAVAGKGIRGENATG